MAGFKYIFRAVTLRDTKRLAQAFALSLDENGPFWSINGRFKKRLGVLRVGIDAEPGIGKTTFSKAAAITLVRDLPYVHTRERAVCELGKPYKVWSNWMSQTLSRQIRIYDDLLAGSSQGFWLPPSISFVEPLPKRQFPGIDFVEHAVLEQLSGPVIGIGIEKTEHSDPGSPRIYTMKSTERIKGMNNRAFLDRVHDLRVG